VLGIEWDDAACATRRVAGLETVQADVAALRPLDFGPVTGLIASPPCPSFSRGGKRPADGPLVVEAVEQLAKGNGWRHVPVADPRSLLTIEPLRWALELEPDWIAFEQVPAVLPIWQAMALVLERHGYVASSRVLQAADYGVPQERRRAILMARKGNAPRWPEASHGKVAALDRLPWLTMADAIGWGITDGPSTTVLATSSGGPRPLDGGSGARAKYRRAQDEGRWVGPSYPTGFLRPTLSDVSLLQTFPADYPWQGSKLAEKFGQVGNAVPPRLASALLKAVSA
jgi:DNA (cytosine-5)-methyltransferase 1